MNCRIDDLAVIVKSIHPENVGAWVHVVAPSPDEPAEWIVKAMSPVVGRTRAGVVQRNPAGVFGFCDDCNLQPIRGTRQPASDTTLVPNKQMENAR